MPTWWASSLSWNTSLSMAENWGRTLRSPPGDSTRTLTGWNHCGSWKLKRQWNTRLYALTCGTFTRCSNFYNGPTLRMLAIRLWKHLLENGYLYGLTEAEMAFLQCWRLIQLIQLLTRILLLFSKICRWNQLVNLCQAALATCTALMAAACFSEEQAKSTNLHWPTIHSSPSFLMETTHSQWWVSSLSMCVLN